MSSFLCKYCDNTYSHKSSLSRHVRSAHTNDKENDAEDKKKSFWCTDCGIGFSSAAPLLQHMQERHNQEVAQTKLFFQSFDAFLQWKEEEESRTSARYVQRSQARVCNEAKVFYFYCNRSGFYKSKGENKRSLKTQGTCKIDCYCTSYMKVKQLLNNTLEVEYCSTHHNHQKDIAHLTLPHNVKLLIATKIQQGVAVERIMDDVRDTIRYGDTPNREHLTTMKDIHNIKKTLNMHNIQKHHSDPASVQIWVSQLRENESYSPVLYFKQQGDIDESGRLDKDDFLLCIQSDFQLDMMKRFGNRAICMDATHGTNQYNFLLITVLVIDEFGEGVPVAWAISSRETQVCLQVYLEAVHERCGHLTPSIFMSDDAIQYWNAWKATYGENTTKKYLCSWHIDRSWRNALARHVEDTPARAEIYAKLRVVMAETIEKELMNMLQHLMSYLTTNHLQFAEYFRSNYLNRIEEWSSYHRIGTLVNTNMHVEAFHRVLKYIYLNGKQNKRLDSLLHALLKIARDKWFERLQKCTKGKSTYRIADINKRHAKAIELTNNTVVERISDCSWKVSENDSSANHVIEKQPHNCKCSIKCRQCGVCPDLFTCSCVDYALHSTACKHIHLLCLMDKEIIADTNDHSPIDMHSQQSNVDDTHSQEEHVQVEPESDKLERLRQKILMEATAVTVIKLCLSIDCSYESPHFSQTYFKVRSYFKPHNAIPHNARISTQRYHSTRRKRQRRSVHTLLKPTDEEVKRIRLEMSNTCSVCFQEDPAEIHEHTQQQETGEDGDEEVMWVQCSHCCLWFHLVCVGDIDCSEDFMCFVCKRTQQ